MARNKYFSHGAYSEQIMYEDIIIESMKIYGQDLFYIPRDAGQVDEILGEDVLSSFDSSYRIEMYVDNVEGFDGEGDIFAKFGVEIRDAVTLTVARRRFASAVKKHDKAMPLDRPTEGDLIYVPFGNKLFEIMHVEHEQPFYQLQNLPVFKLRCELFEFSGESFDVGIPKVDDLRQKDYQIELTLATAEDTVGDDFEHDFEVGMQIYQKIANTTDSRMNGIVANWDGTTTKLSVSNFGSSDGVWREFSVGDLFKDVNGFDILVGTVTVVDTYDPIDTAQDDAFESVSTDFLDFTESNPFGDI